MLLQRVSAFGSELDIRREPLFGVTYNRTDFTVYWLDPGSSSSAFVFAVTLNF